MEEIDYREALKHWMDFKIWAMVDGKWRDGTLMLARVKIRSYLSAPQFVGFGGVDT